MNHLYSHIYLLTKPHVIDFWHLKPFNDDYGIDKIKLCPHGCHFTVSDAPSIHTRYIVVCQNEVRQLQAQVLKSLVETGVIIHKPSKCSHPALKLNGEV